MHLYRNVLSHTPNNKVGEVARMLKAVVTTEIVEKMKDMKLHKAALGAGEDGRDPHVSRLPVESLAAVGTAPLYADQVAARM